jgi:hypothetical protein
MKPRGLVGASDSLCLQQRTARASGAVQEIVSELITNNIKGKVVFVLN